MKIALVQCPAWGTYDPPVALAQLSSCLKREGHGVKAFDLNIKLYRNRADNYKNMWAWEQSLFWYDEGMVNKFFRDNAATMEDYARKIIDTGADIIGFSVNAASKLFSIELSRILKSKNKEAVIIFGGQLFFEDKSVDSIFDEGPVDIVVIGEGEATFCELTGLMQKAGDISSCSGIAFNKAHSVVRTAYREPISNLDSLPFLDFSDMPFSDYDDSRHFSFMSSRGCVQRCAFCSSRVFWNGYRTMSGERIFGEIEFHKNKEGSLNPNLAHVDFLDLLLNGSMKSLVDFCDLMIKAKLDIYWTANMIIRPEMDSKVIKKMKQAGCEHVIFGIESGSQRVLDLMKKNYKIEDADRIIKLMYDAGITTTCNFMFGFPGETETDFELTLDFIRRNVRFLSRVYPSRTYCAIEEHSYLHEHLEEFNIKPNPPNHLYWENVEGGNTYPVRLERCEEFCKLASSLGVEVGCGVQTSVELDKWYSLSFYYECVRDYKNAVSCLLEYNRLDPSNQVISDKINFYNEELKREKFGSQLDGQLLIALQEAAANKQGGQVSALKTAVFKLGRGHSLALFRQNQKDNSQLNDVEFESRRIILQSSPKTFFLQVAGPCNSSCAFCSRGTGYEFFKLVEHIERFDDKISVFLQKAEQIILTGSGEFLLLPESREILDYFDYSFPQAEKMFSTNGSGLTPAICEKIANSNSRYTIHVSLHASNSSLHKVMTRMDSFHKIVDQLDCLLKLKKNTGNPSVNLIFVATTLNIEDLPNFVRFAANLGADKVICYYNYIYVLTQKYLSCFFKQELANKAIDEAERVAGNLNIKIDLPPKFGLSNYPVIGVCREPWSQVMLNSQGDVISCDASEDSNENLTGKNLMDVWNGPYYQRLRKGLADRTCSCFKHCFRANLSMVNDFSSHVIHRGRDSSKIDILWGDNF